MTIKTKEKWKPVKNKKSKICYVLMVAASTSALSEGVALQQMTLESAEITITYWR